MKQICQRHIAKIRNLEEDLFENICHYKETGDDEDLINSCIDQIRAIINASPDVIPENRIEPDPDKKWIYSPQDPEVQYGRFGHLVTVEAKLEAGGSYYNGDPVYKFLVSFCEDGYKAYAYEDELEEV